MKTRGVVAALVLLACPGFSAAASFFRPLGDLDPQLPGTIVRGVSNGGAVVVGSCVVNGPVIALPFACRWTEATGWQALTEGDANAVSVDGAVIVGNAGVLGGTSDAFRWTQSNGVVKIVDPGRYSFAYDVSADGSVVAGTVFEPFPEQAFRWTAATGAVPIGPVGAEELGISADGSVIVGDGPTFAFRWTEASGMVSLPGLPGSVGSSGRDVSPDGLVSVGASFELLLPFYYNQRPVRWSATGIVEALELLPGMAAGFANAVAAGSVIVGSQAVDPRALGDIAFLWDPIHRSRSLQAVLEQEHGLDLTGWTLTDAGAISPDGRAIVGSGVNPTGKPEVWLAVLECSDPVDSDGDGVGDACDDCSHTPNTDQKDTGGVGAGSPADGIGNACQCGDVTGDGQVTIADSVVISRSLLAPPTATQAHPELCDVDGDGQCTAADAVALRRALLQPPTAAIQQLCGPAKP